MGIFIATAIFIWQTNSQNNRVESKTEAQGSRLESKMETYGKESTMPNWSKPSPAESTVF